MKKKKQALYYYGLGCALFICCALFCWQPLPAGETALYRAAGPWSGTAAKQAEKAAGQESPPVAGEEYVPTPLRPDSVEGPLFKLEIVTETIAYGTIYQDDGGLERGRFLTLLEGREGLKEIAFRVLYAGGREIYREVAAEMVLVEPRDAVVAVGTKPRQSQTIASREKTIIPYREEGIASWYGAEFQGDRTSNGEIYDKHELTAAHPTLPFGTLVKVTYLRNGREVVVRINDRGPYVKGRIIDLSRAAAQEIGLKAHGVGKVRLEVLEMPGDGA